VSTEQVDAAIERIEEKMLNLGVREVPSTRLGEWVMRELKKLDPEVRAIVSSGYDNDEMVQRYLDLGFCGYLTKPYRVADLGRAIKTVVG
jgi:transcriptional regulator NrdR family protein